MSCPTCGHSETRPYFVKHTPAGAYAIVRCAQCGLLYLDDRPSAEALAQLYQSPAYFEADARGYASDYLQQRGAIEREAARRLAVLEGRLGGRGRLLDIGCAAGFFLAAARARGWDVRGVEVAPAMAAYARETLHLEVRPSFEAEAYAPGSLDAVTLWEVIEHLPAPLETLRQATARLRPGGLLALSTPNTGHWQAQRRPEWWSEFKPPVHVLYFTEATLRDLLARAGFTQVEIVRTRPLDLSPQGLARLQRLRGLLGDGAAPRTPLWPVTSLLYRVAGALAGAWHHARHPGDDSALGLEAYARRPA